VIVWSHSQLARLVRACLCLSGSSTRNKIALAAHVHRLLQLLLCSMCRDHHQTFTSKQIQISSMLAMLVIENSVHHADRGNAACSVALQQQSLCIRTFQQLIDIVAKG
jgi:hypothetical protein